MSEAIAEEEVVTEEVAVSEPKIMIEYVRTKKRQKRGVLAAKKINGKVFIGWSMCKLKMDKFDRDRGKQIAIGRANKGVMNDDSIKLPGCIKKQAREFKKRCEKYYDTNQIILVQPPVKPIKGTPKPQAG
jgi:hypothetical protein